MEKSLSPPDFVEGADLPCCESVMSRKKVEESADNGANHTTSLDCDADVIYVVTFVSPVASVAYYHSTLAGKCA